jgi:hypothetical protein
VARVASIEIVETLTLGDAIVGAGTLLLALFTWRLGRATFALDKRTAKREEARHAREVRGIARLVDGDLATTNAMLRSAIEDQAWRWTYKLPRRIWERHGAPLADALSDDAASDLAVTFGRLLAWEQATTLAQENYPAMNSIPIPPGQLETLVALQASVTEARVSLRVIAYGGRDVPPDSRRWLQAVERGGA